MMRLLAVLAVLAALGRPAVAQTLPDHALFDSVLAQYLHDGLVDYAGLAANRVVFDRYLEQLGHTSPSALNLVSRDARLAFWINAYNACAMRLVIDHYPIERRGGIAGLANRVVGVPANSIRQIPDTWDRAFCYIAQRDRSLDGIEHGVIRLMGDPRIHFAVNCASRSCPVLAAQAYRASRINEQLDDAVRRFVASPLHFRLDEGDPPVLHVNKVLDWYKDDFGDTADIITFLRRYLPAAEARLLDPDHVRVEFLEYDWTLNDTAVFGTEG